MAEILSLPEAEITDSISAFDTPNWDSLATVNLIAAVEEAYAIAVDLEDLASFTSVAEIRRILKQRGIDA